MTLKMVAWRAKVEALEWAKGLGGDAITWSEFRRDIDAEIERLEEPR